jgi:hypothetical protein
VEHSVDPDGEKALQDGCRDGLVRAAEDLAQHRLGVARMNLAAWDAWAGVRLDALAHECLELPPLGADAEKLVGPEQVCPEPAGLT